MRQVRPCNKSTGGELSHTTRGGAKVIDQGGGKGKIELTAGGRGFRNKLN